MRKSHPVSAYLDNARRRFEREQMNIFRFLVESPEKYDIGPGEALDVADEAMRLIQSESSRLRRPTNMLPGDMEIIAEASVVCGWEASKRRALRDVVSEYVKTRCAYTTPSEEDIRSSGVLFGCVVALDVLNLGCRDDLCETFDACASEAVLRDVSRPENPIARKFFSAARDFLDGSEAFARKLKELGDASWRSLVAGSSLANSEGIGETAFLLLEGEKEQSTWRFRETKPAAPMMNAPSEMENSDSKKARFCILLAKPDMPDETRISLAASVVGEGYMPRLLDAGVLSFDELPLVDAEMSKMDSTAGHRFFTAESRWRSEFVSGILLRRMLDMFPSSGGACEDMAERAFGNALVSMFEERASGRADKTAFGERLAEAEELLSLFSARLALKHSTPEYRETEPSI